MENDLEIKYRTQAQLNIKRIDNKQYLMTKVIYEELLPYFQYERAITGQYLRIECPQPIYQTYTYQQPQGQTLYELIKQNKQFNLNEIQTIIKQLLYALLQIHKKKSLGRCFDIKNIYYHNQIITLTSFGFYPDLQLKPPEFIKRKLYSSQIDIWLLGCILYQLCTNKILEPFLNYEQYSQFYINLQQENIDLQFKDLLYKMLFPNEIERLTFHELYQKSIFLNQEYYSFYFDQFRSYDYTDTIKERELIDSNYLEWAVPKENQDGLKVPIIEIRHYRRISQEIPYISQTEPDQTQPIIKNKQDLTYSGFRYIQTQEIERETYEDPDCLFLSFRNRNKPETALFGQIWREIHFQSYRFYLLIDLLQTLDRIDQFPYIEWAKYGILKMSIIIRKQFISQIENQQNFCGFDINLWKQFLNTSKQLQQQFRDLKTMLELHKSEIEDRYQISLQQEDLTKEEKKLFKQIEQYITNQINEESFEDYKIPYRLILSFLYKKLDQNILNENDQEHKKFFAQLQLKVIICMTINTIFNSQLYTSFGNRNDYFLILKNALQIDNLTSPYYVDKFLETASIEQLIQQTHRIYQIYF